MTFHKQPFKTRLGSMGDMAEAVFEDMYPNHHRLGLNRPPMNVGMLNDNLRYTPDYIEQSLGLVEVMGLGGDGLLKVKTEKMRCLLLWDTIAPVHLFVYSSKAKDVWVNPIEAWWMALMNHGVLDHFEDNGKPYLALDVDYFPMT